VIRRLEFTVLGTPAPKGSRRGMSHAGKGKSLPGGSKANEQALISWSSAVRAAALRAVMAARGEEPGTIGIVPPPGTFFAAVPLRMTAVFRMRRPGSHYNKKTGQIKPGVPRYCITKPDTSKLLRATEDDLHGIVIIDDSHFAEHLIRKVYAAPGSEGAWILIEAL
jgi:hypothetical protein